MISYELHWGGKAAEDALRGAAAEGLRLAAEHLLQASRERVPIEEGTLERSGTVTVDEAALQAAVSYDTPYAVRQHEDMSLRHDAGRHAKYLEGPARSEADTMQDIIAARIRRALR